MLDLEELNGRLLRMDEDDQLTLDDENKYYCYIVGGGALILMWYISRATHDLDIINVPPSLISLLSKYDMNTSVSAYMDSFPDDYLMCAVKIDISTQKINFYSLSLEDLVISKLCSSRYKDIRDITSETVVSAIDWDQLAAVEQCDRSFF